MIGYKAVYGALSSGAANNFQVPGMYLSNVQVTTCTYRMYNWATKFYIYIRASQGAHRFLCPLPKG